MRVFWQYIQGMVRTPLAPSSTSQLTIPRAVDEFGQSPYGSDPHDTQHARVDVQGTHEGRAASVPRGDAGGGTRRAGRQELEDCQMIVHYSVLCNIIVVSSIGSHTTAIESVADRGKTDC